MSKKVDPQSLETWRPYKKGLCNDCWAGCCTMPVEVRAADLVRLGLMSEAELDFDLQDVAHRLFKKKIIQAYSRKTGVMVLEQVSGRDCIYLHPQTRRCTVYEKRPDTCRNFPRVGPKPNFCPYGPHLALARFGSGNPNDTR